MAKRQLTRADKELLEQVDVLLKPGLERPSATMLERWRQAGFLPSQPNASTVGSSRATRPARPEHVVALMRPLKVHDTSRRRPPCPALSQVRATASERTFSDRHSSPSP